MGWLANLNKPTISHEVPDLPREGGQVQSYEVMGVWGPDGSVDVPARIIITTDSGQHCEKPGDILNLTRLEAAVLGKTFMLSPIITKAE